MINEITVKLKCSVEEICEILECKKFEVVEKYSLNDTYFIPESLNLKRLTPREILSNAILVRDIREYIPARRVCKLTFKRKEIDENGTILNQEKIDCEIVNVEAGKKLIKAIGYKQLMNIKENDIVYGKDGLEIAVKDITNGDKLIEIETVENNTELDTIEKLKKKINNLQLPLDINNYFVKKAEIELKKIL